MPSSSYYQRQAEVCRRLAGVSAMPHVTLRLLRKAEEYEAKINASSSQSSAEVTPAAEDRDQHDRA